MSTNRRPLAALTGAAFCLLGVAGTLAYPSDPGFAGEPAAIARFYTENEGALLGANTLYLFAGVMLIVFSAYLRSALGEAEGDDGRLATVAFAGGLAGATLSLGAASLDMSAALRVGEQGAIAPEVATAMWDGSNVLFGLAAPMAFAAMVLATALAARRTAILPAWHAALGGLLGIALLVPPINHVAVIVFTFWALATGVLLYLAGEQAGAPAGAAVAAA